MAASGRRSDRRSRRRGDGLGVRGRLSVALVALVVASVVLLGLAAYAFVEGSLRGARLAEAESQARFDLETLPLALGTTPSYDDLVANPVRESLRRRGVDTIIDAGTEAPILSDSRLAGALDRLSPEVRGRVAGGELAYEWTAVGGGPSLVVGGRLGADGPIFYFVRDATDIETALFQLRVALVGGGLILVLLALATARSVARGVLTPVEAAARTAERIAGGDLSARVPVTSRDEFGAFAERFNHMAAALDATIGRLREAESRNRRFVADVSHELRTPLAALVAEASVLRERLPDVPEHARRPAELLIDDVARLRVLVEELMELSRFDAAAERSVPEPVDLTPIVRSIAAERLPGSKLDLPSEPVIVATDPRRVVRILSNLLDNAREHAPGAPVTTSLGVDGGEVTLAVADRGPGVPDALLPHLFDRFMKLDAARSGGSGLGLAIAAEHAALIGGSLRASNQAGGGLRVELRLPVTEPLPAGDGPAARETEASGWSPPPQESSP